MRETEENFYTHSTHTRREREGEFLKYTVDSYLNSHVALFTTLGISTIVQGR